MISEWIKSYNPQNDDQLLNAKREIVQEIALSGLHRGRFFDHACFYGGTALRIFYGLNRYSEDLDFSLYKEDKSFSFEKYKRNIEEEFDLLGLCANVTVKKKKNPSPIESAFLKDNTEWSFLNIDFGKKDRLMPSIKVKIEADTDPPTGFKVENKLLQRPFSTLIPCMIPQDLFAGKMHALFYRKYRHNEKGRDWFDLIWYAARKIPVGLFHFNHRAKASNGIEEGTSINHDDLIKLLHERIDLLKIDMAKKDISRFISDPVSVNIWSKDYFHQIADSIQTTNE